MHAKRLSAAPSLELEHDLGARLTAHVKLEENELFPLIEEAIPEAELEVLASRLLIGGNGD